MEDEDKTEDRREYSEMFNTDMLYDPGSIVKAIGEQFVADVATFAFLWCATPEGQAAMTKARYMPFEDGAIFLGKEVSAYRLNLSSQNK